ncbi:LPXTG cell wall anchor domain-containing protein [Micromonospora sp. C28ISP2-4]|uniref:LPXTG cell wall anchor domain-containing protein n=1 Tax=Micromonospora sp. C28ISP2-4 TaxID=3059523 RepID=UPI0026750F3E|nr:LPXTG cell wall anchor domain-containing protein [Micromonospora sp. C28ISP2-4]MDO3683727.1 LPXTG cell wall anchor domain-containing protein [Micromonospora sp. C28ISP2-4]
MLSNSTRRWFAGLGVAGAFVAASATPALAADAPFEVVTHDLLVAPGHLGYGSLFAHMSDGESEPTFGRTTIDIDFSAVSGFATVEPAWDWTCDVSSTKLHCEADLADGDEPWFDYLVNGKDTAEPGQEGALKISVTSGGKTATGTAGVTIAEGVDLVSDPTVEASGAPGGRAAVPGVVRNGGDTTVDGTVLVVQADWLASYGGNFSNCRAQEDGFYAFCAFDTKIEPGRSYKLSEDLPITLRPETRTGARFPVYLDWWTTDDFDQAFEDWLDEVKPGTGPELRLVEKSVQAARVPQTDLDQMNNFTVATVKVTGDNPADLAAEGATATGKKGDVVTVAPSFTNLGPATLEYLGQSTPGIRLEDLPVRVTVPAGTTAVEAPYDCVPFLPTKEWDPWTANWGEPGAKEYACQVTESPKGMKNPYEFRLRIDTVTANAAGSFTTKLSGDPNGKNDTAAIVINPAGGGTPGTPGNPGDGGQGGGDGGTLPITGSSTGLIAGVGALLLAAGAVGYVLTRRRKTRFVA